MSTILHAFTVRVGRRAVRVQAPSPDSAVFAALGAARSDAPGFRGVTLDDATPRVDGRFGAPMGRSSDRLDADGFPCVRRVRIDAQGYDKGGAYWGLRPRGKRLYAVQDGMGNLAFVDAPSHDTAFDLAVA